MARPLAFDPETARNKALVLFWRKGYQATSLADLLDALEISRSSFYAAFRDKRQLFITCLDVFAQRTRQILERAGDDRLPLDALQFFLERHLDTRRRNNASLGCLLVNTVLEMTDVDDELAGRACGHLSDIEREFARLLRAAGCSSNRAREFAALLMLLNEGIRVASRRRLPLAAQRAPITATFTMLRQVIPHPAGTDRTSTDVPSLS